MRPARQRLITAPVDEVRYLAAGTNTSRYRLIMRHFYEQHRLHHYALAPSQVLAHMRTVLPDYSEDECQQDLDVLVGWSNLAPDWELGLAGVRTIDDFKRRNVLYSATPDAIAIEELMVRLENQGEQVGELDSSAMGRIWELLDRFEQTAALPPSDPARMERIRPAWEDLWSRFSQMADSSNKYMGDMRRQERERLLDLNAFQIYKAALIGLLTRFADGLAAYREPIRRRAEAWDAEALTHTMTDSALASTRSFERREHLLQEYRDQIAAFASWFAPGGSADTLRLYASHAIERVARTARRLSESRRGAVSRAQDLLTVADRFFACRSLAQSERLAALAFGLTLPRHWQYEVPEQAADQPERSAWEAQPLETVIRQRRLHGARRQDLGTSIADLEQRKAALRARDRHRQAEAAALVSRLFAKGALVMGEAEGLSPTERDLVLGWVYECLANMPACSTRSQDGSTLQIANSDETRYVWLEAPDGRVLVPNYRLERQTEGT